MQKSRSKNFLKLFLSHKESINECLVQHLPINIFLLDKEGYICWVNQHLLKNIGSRLDEVQGLHISHWSYVRWEYAYEVLMNKEMTIHEEHYGNDYFSTIRKPLLDKKGEVIGLLGVSVAITERKKAEIAKKQFLNNIRHDIRTPVSGIIGLVEVLRDAIEDPELIVLVESLKDTSVALLQLLDRVFESIQISTGEFSKLSCRFSLRDTLETVYKLHCAKAKEKNLELTFYYDTALPIMVVGEAMRVQRLVWELLTNALKYTERGSIQLKAYLIKLTDEEVIVEIQVKDTGIGIPLDKQDIIFRKFTRLTSSWTGGVLGQGLGLFNVKQLVADLGGKIYLESAVDTGSAFICRINFKRTYA